VVYHVDALEIIPVLGARNNMLNHHAMENHEHEHEMQELTDDELDQVSGGAPKTTMCPCKKHTPRPETDM
jgi:bacteriocin-like protein